MKYSTLSKNIKSQPPFWVCCHIPEYSTLSKNIKSQLSRMGVLHRVEYSTLSKNIKSQPESTASSSDLKYSTLSKNIKSQPFVNVADDFRIDISYSYVKIGTTKSKTVNSRDIIQNLSSGLDLQPKKNIQEIQSENHTWWGPWGVLYIPYIGNLILRI